MDDAELIMLSLCTIAAIAVGDAICVYIKFCRAAAEKF